MNRCPLSDYCPMTTEVGHQQRVVSPCTRFRHPRRMNMTKVEDQNLTPSTTGLVLHGTARFYDLMAWFVMLGRERVFREKLIDLARLKTGESVLDVGCGTGNLSIADK